MLKTIMKAMKKIIIKIKKIMKIKKIKKKEQKNKKCYPFVLKYTKILEEREDYQTTLIHCPYAPDILFV